MKVGDLVWIDWNSYPKEAFTASGVIVKDEGFSFFRVLFNGEQRVIHSDYLETLNEA